MCFVARGNKVSIIIFDCQFTLNIHTRDSLLEPKIANLFIYNI